MKVLILANYKSSTGGISGQVTLLHQYLNQDGIKADIYSTKANVLTRLKMFKDLRQKAINYDVLHIHCCSYIGFFPAVLGIHVGRQQNKRIVLTYHGGDADRFFKRYKRFVHHYLNKTNANIVLSGFLANIFDKYKIQYTIIPNIVPINESCYIERKAVKPLYISVRTLEPLYNVECIIRAFEIVKSKLSDAQLYILSDGSSKSGLQKYVLNHNIKDVYFVGRVPNKDIYKYLNKADIFLSMPKIDNQPMSVLEAFKCGLLVISSNVGGVPYLVEDNKTGVLVESNNVECLAEQMLTAIENPHKTIEMMQAGHQSLSQYTWDNIKLKLLSIYK